MRNIIYIINPIAGTKVKKGLQQFIEERTKQEQIPFTIIPSVPSGDYSFLHDKIKNEKITDIIIAGGDGTVSQVINSLKDFDVNFGIIPCGSGNGLAYAAKIPKDPKEALNIIFKGTPSFIDGFYISDPLRSGTGRHFACMLCGLGFDAKVAYDFALQTKRGFMMYLKHTLKNFIFSKTYSFELEFQHSKLQTEAYFISIANSNQFGNQLTIAPKASLSDGLLDIIIVTKQNKLSFALNTLKQIGGWNKLQTGTIIEKNKAVIYFQTDKLTISNPDKAHFHIDGEPAPTPEKIKVEIIKNCFRLIQP